MDLPLDMLVAVVRRFEVENKGQVCGAFACKDNAFAGRMLESPPDWLLEPSLETMIYTMSHQILTHTAMDR